MYFMIKENYSIELGKSSTSPLCNLHYSNNRDKKDKKRVTKRQVSISLATFFFTLCVLVSITKEELKCATLKLSFL